MEIEQTDHSKKYTITLCDGKQVTLEIYCEALGDNDKSFGHDISFTVTGLAKPDDILEERDLFPTEDPRLLRPIKILLDKLLRSPPNHTKLYGPQSTGPNTYIGVISFKERYVENAEDGYDSVEHSKAEYAQYVEKLDAAMPAIEDVLQTAYTGPYKEPVHERILYENEEAKRTANFELRQPIAVVIYQGRDKAVDDLIEDILALLPPRAAASIRENMELYADLKTVLEQRGLHEDVNETAMDFIHTVERAGVNIVPPKRSNRDVGN